MRTLTIITPFDPAEKVHADPALALIRHVIDGPVTMDFEVGTGQRLSSRKLIKAATDVHGVISHQQQICRQIGYDAALIHLGAAESLADSAATVPPLSGRGKRQSLSFLKQMAAEFALAALVVHPGSPDRPSVAAQTVSALVESRPIRWLADNSDLLAVLATEPHGSRQNPLRRGKSIPPAVDHTWRTLKDATVAGRREQARSRLLP